MRLRSRTVFFWSLVFLCIATILAIIFYSFGYRYRFDRGIFVYTGSISLKVNPTDNLQIALDGQPVDVQASTLNSSFHLTGIRPGLHHVAIKADGFQTWEKEVPVSSGVSTDFWNITLIRSQYAPTTLVSHPGIRKFYPAPNQKLLAYSVQTDQEASVHTINIDTGEDIQVFSRPRVFFRADDRENIEWSVDSDALTLPLFDADGHRTYTIVSLTDTTFPATDLKDTTSLNQAHDLRWDPQTRHTLLFLDGTTLKSLSLEDPTAITTLTENVLSYDISGNTLYTLESPAFLVWQAPINHPDARTQITGQAPQNITPTDQLSLIVYDASRLFILDRSTKALTLFNNGPTRSVFTTLSQDATGAQFSNDGKKLLYWDDWEVSVYFLRDWEAQPARSEDQNSEITRFSQPIHFVQWTKDYEHILLTTPTSIEILELDNRSRLSQKLPLDTPSTVRQITPLFSKNKLFILQSTNHDVPDDETLASVSFPEPVFRFGIIQQ